MFALISPRVDPDRASFSVSSWQTGPEYPNRTLVSRLETRNAGSARPRAQAAALAASKRAKRSGRASPYGSARSTQLPADCPVGLRVPPRGLRRWRPGSAAMRRCHHRRARCQDDLGWPVPCSWCLGFHGRRHSRSRASWCTNRVFGGSRTTSSTATVCRSSCDTAVLGAWFCCFTGTCVRRRPSIGPLAGCARPHGGMRRSAGVWPIQPTPTDDPVRIPSAPAPAACARQWAP
jgi:hypothetical protein